MARLRTLATELEHQLEESERRRKMSEHMCESMRSDVERLTQELLVGGALGVNNLGVRASLSLDECCPAQTLEAMTGATQDGSVDTLSASHLVPMLAECRILFRVCSPPCFLVDAQLWKSGFM